MKTIHVLAILLTLGLFGGAFACCQPTPIAGKVMDDCDSKPVGGALAKVESDKGETNEFGWFHVTAHGNGWKWLTVRKDGYKVYRTKVDVVCGRPILLYIRLAREYGCEPERWCGNEVCDQTTAYSENCSTCPQDCGECEEPEPEPEPKRIKKASPNNCDHCFFVGGLTRYYQNLQYGWWYRYAVDCGIEYDRSIPPQNLRYLCNLKEAMK